MVESHVRLIFGHKGHACKRLKFKCFYTKPSWDWPEKQEAFPLLYSSDCHLSPGSLHPPASSRPVALCLLLEVKLWGPCHEVQGSPSAGQPKAYVSLQRLVTLQTQHIKWGVSFHVSAKQPYNSWAPQVFPLYLVGRGCGGRGVGPDYPDPQRQLPVVRDRGALAQAFDILNLIQSKCSQCGR